MKLSSSAKEILTNAQALRLENDHKSLCVEHLLYGVLLLGKENSSDGRKVKEYLAKEMINPEAALTQLRIDAKEDSSFFRDAAPVLGRVTEMAGEDEISAMIFAKAVLESNTPTVLALKGLVAVHGQPGKELVPEKPAKPGNNNGNNNGNNSIGNNNNGNNNNGNNAHDLAMLLLLFALLNNSRKEELVRNSGNRFHRGNAPKVRRRTKMGLFTYRGGTVAAAIQYFLFGILVPVVIIAVLQRFTGVLNMPAAPLRMFLVGTFGVMWMFYLARGIAILFGIASSAFGNFLNILSDIGMIAAMVRVIQFSWHMPTVPVWLRAVASVSILLVMMFGSALFEYLRDEGDVRKVKITFMNVKGTPGKIFFQYVVKIMVVPVLIYAVIWTFSLTPPAWLVKTFLVLGFGYFWNIINAAFSCISLGSEKKGSAAKRFFLFLKTIVSYLFLPALVIYLHRLFMWSPVKTWVIVVMVIYMVLTMILSITYAAVKD